MSLFFKGRVFKIETFSIYMTKDDANYARARAVEDSWGEKHEVVHVREVLKKKRKGRK
jgi:hypothetical protein